MDDNLLHKNLLQILQPDLLSLTFFDSFFSGANKSVVMQEFVAMDERMTNQMLSVQQQAVNLGLLAQKLEDDLGTSSGSSKGKNFFGLRKKKSGAANSGGGNGLQNRDSTGSRSSTLTSVDPNRPYSPVDLGMIYLGDLKRAIDNLSDVFFRDRNWLFFHIQFPQKMKGFSLFYF